MYTIHINLKSFLYIVEQILSIMTNAMNIIVIVTIYIHI